MRKPCETVTSAAALVLGLRADEVDDFAPMSAAEALAYVFLQRGLRGDLGAFDRLASASDVVTVELALDDDGLTLALEELAADLDAKRPETSKDVQ